MARDNDNIKVHLQYDPRYVIPRVGNLTEEKSIVSIVEFPTGICVETKFWLLSNYDAVVCVTN
jgi:hypothetical protein